MTIQHLRSSTANKRPTPAAMSDGQLAVNTNTASPGLFFKDSAGALIKVGPVHVGTTAPNASPASGGETGNTVGEQWLDTTGGTYVFKVWDGSAWRSESGTFVDVNGDVMTGALGIIAGSAGSPGLYFSGDTNTGLYSPGSDQLALATGGTGRLFIDSNGRLGVGTGSPDANLDIVRGSSGTVATFGIEGLTANPRLRIDVDETNNTVTFNPNYSGATSPSLVFNTQEAERLRITSAGLVGIGTSSPQSAVDVLSGVRGVPETSGSTTSVTTLRLRGSSNGVLDIGELSSATAGSYWLQVRDRTDLGYEYNLALQPNGGNVGIGTTTPQTTLDCNGNIRVPNNTFYQSSDGSGGWVELIKADSSNNTAIANNKNLAITFATGGAVAERARIDSSGRLLVGTSSSSAEAKFIVQGGATGSGGWMNIQRNATTASAGSTIGVIDFTNSSNNVGARVIAEGDGTWSAGTSHPTRLVFATTADGASSSTERMRITQAGHVFVGNVTGDYNTVGVSLFSDGYLQAVTSGRSTLALNRKGSDGVIVDFYRDTNNPGTISVTTTATSYNTSSDYRLKENVTPVTDGITRLQQLKPSRFNFIAAPGCTVDGFIAHEVQSVVPEAITGEKDAVDTDGKPQYQGIDQSKLVPLLTAALQEAVAKIESLEARLTAAGI